MSAITVNSTPVRYEASTGASSHTQSFTVPAGSKALVVMVTHEGSPTTNTVKFGGVDLTKRFSSTSDRLSVWVLLNPTASTANVVAALSGSTNACMEIFTLDHVDVSSGFTSAIKGEAVFSSPAVAGTDCDVSITTSVNDTFVITFGYFNDETKTLANDNSQTDIDDFATTVTTNKWRFRLGYLTEATAGTYSVGYTGSGNSSSTAGARAAIAIAFKDDSSVTLADLTLTQTTVAPGINEDVSFTIANKTSGSTVKLYDGVTLVATTTGTTITITGGYATAGLKTLSVVEELTGATNTPHTSAASVSLRIYITLNVLTIGSSSLDHWTLPGSWSTTETPNGRIKVWNIQSSDGSGPGGYVGIASYAGAGKGCGGIAFGNRLLALLDGASPDTYRIGLIPTARGGSTLAGWITPASYYTVLLSVVSAILATGNSIQCMLSVVGSNDARGGNISSTAQFMTDLRTLFNSVRTDTGLSTLPIFMMGAQRSAALQQTSVVASTSSGSNVLTVTAVNAGAIYVGQPISGSGIPSGTTITAFGTGTGGTGTYTMSANATNTGSKTVIDDGETGTDTMWARCRAGELTVGDDSNNHVADTVVDLPLHTDGAHLSMGISGGEASRARRVAEAVFKELFNGAGAHAYTGPKPGTPTYYSANGLVLIPFTMRAGAELVGETGQTALDGFEFFSSADTGFTTPLTPSTAPYVSGSAQVAAVIDTGLPGVVVKYQEKRNPTITNRLMDNAFLPDSAT